MWPSILPWIADNSFVPQDWNPALQQARRPALQGFPHFRGVMGCTVVLQWRNNPAECHATWPLATATRCNAQTTRCSAQTTRCSDQTTRCSDPTTRCSAQTTRCSGPTTRCNAQTTRCNAQTTRCSDQTTRCSGQTTRCSDQTTCCSDQTTCCSDKRRVGWALQRVVLRKNRGKTKKSQKQ